MKTRPVLIKLRPEQHIHAHLISGRRSPKVCRPSPYLLSHERAQLDQSSSAQTVTMRVLFVNQFPVWLSEQRLHSSGLRLRRRVLARQRSRQAGTLGEKGHPCPAVRTQEGRVITDHFYKMRRKKKKKQARESKVSSDIKRLNLRVN